MIVECPNCATKYNLPDEMFKDGGKARCKVCEFVFPLSKEPASRPSYSLDDAVEEKSVDEMLGGLDDREFDPLRDSTPVDPVDSLDDDLAAFAQQDDGSDDGFEEEINLPSFLDSAGEKGASRKNKDDDWSEPGGEVEDLRDSLNLDIEGTTSKKKTKKKGKKKAKSNKKSGSLLKFLLFVLFLVLLGGGAFFGVSIYAPEVLDELPMTISDVKKIISPGDTAGDMDDRGGAKKVDVIPTSQVKNIILTNIKQYYVNNEKIGKIFVVEGSVVNQFSVPKEMIQVEVNLYDANGLVLASKQQYCGNTLSLFQLQVLSEEELEAQLNNKLGILAKNIDVKPEGDVPFLVAFYAPPETVSEFAVNVIAAKDTPEQ